MSTTLSLGIASGMTLVIFAIIMNEYRKEKESATRRDPADPDDPEDESTGREDDEF